MPEVTILGPNLETLAAQHPGGVWPGTLFLRHHVLVTDGPMHAKQRLAFIEFLNRERQAQGQPPLSGAEVGREFAESADLFLEFDAAPRSGVAPEGEAARLEKPEPKRVLIRPDPAHLHLMWEADELLQRLVSKRRIKFMYVFDPAVRQAIKVRGENWRICPLPRAREEMEQLIRDSKVAIGLNPIYYYSQASGTRYLTCQEFAGLEGLPAPALAAQLQEIATHAVARNRLHNPEVGFFAADELRFHARDLAGLKFTAMPEAELRARFAELRDRFREAVPAELRVDDPKIEPWRQRMVAALVHEGRDTESEEILRELASEFFLQVEWLPGGRFEEGEFLPDSLFEEAQVHPEDAELQRLCDPKVRGFIFNFIREYGILDYVNVGRVVHSLSRVRPLKEGRRDVFVAELKPRDGPPLVRFIRLLKWGIREHLDDGQDLLTAMLKTDEYIDYVLDRRLGCQQLGMNLPPHVTIHRVPEVYRGQQREYHGRIIHAPYGERDYQQGTATDKLPPRKYAIPGYALALARLLGRAAASALIVGRVYQLKNGEQMVVFDDGDEVIVEGEDGLPKELVVSDHSGAFGEYQRPLVSYAKDYARPVNARAALVPNPREFAEAYLAALEEQFVRIQNNYLKHRRAFDCLFNYAHYDPAGSYAYRWECVLRRLRETKVQELIAAIRREIAVL